MSLSFFENNLANQSIDNYQVVEQSDVVLIWPQQWQPNWSTESQVNNCDEMAQWLNTAFGTMRNWTNVNPNTIYLKRNGVWDRLIFVYNGKSDFIFGVPRPYIGLRDGKSPLPGTEDWFGWLLHELSHDFFHEQPFNIGLGDWGDGTCDYSRYHLLVSLGMSKAATNWMQHIQGSSPNDRYGEPARLLLKFEKDNKLRGPIELWHTIKGTDFNKTIGKPTW